MIELVAASELMREALRVAARAAATDAGVLITGESGAGKNALARFIHARSPRAQENYVEIDCGALPRELLEAELFGYERGAFTGAASAKSGRLEAAHKGTLVLDEIAHLTTDAQAKLLRVVERGEFERLGGRRAVKVDARIVALTSVEPEEAVARGALRADLFYRLNVVRIRLAPLRERVADVSPLAEIFLARAAAKRGLQCAAFSREAQTLLESYDFPGNARELAHIIERALVLASDGAHDRTKLAIESSHLPESVRRAASENRSRALKFRTLAEVENEYICEVLAATGGNKSEAARALGISRKNLYERLKRAGLMK